MSPDTLLDRCLTAHGGIDRWGHIRALEVEVSTGGLAFAAHGQRWLQTTALVAAREPLVVLSPYRGRPRGVFEAERVSVQDESSRVLAERKNPRELMGHGSRLLRWDDLDMLYFVGYALSNYVRAPFLFAQAGFQVASAGDLLVAGELWSKLRVTFPSDEPTHCSTQVVYLDRDFRMRRLDYVAEPIGPWARAAQFCFGYRECFGLRMPTERRVVPRISGDRALPWLRLVQVRIEAVRPVHGGAGSHHSLNGFSGGLDGTGEVLN